MDFQSSPSGEEDTTRDDSQPTAANTPYHGSQEDQGIVVPALGVASLRPPPEIPAVDPAGNSPAREERLAGVLEIVAQVTPRITDDALVQRIQTFVGYYAGMLEV